MQFGKGANLGCETVYDLSRPYLEPIAVPRLQYGTPMRDALWTIKIIPASICGLSPEVMSERGYQLAWRNDVGLVLNTAGPAEYESLVVEVEQANWDAEIDNVGPQWPMIELAV